MFAIVAALGANAQNWIDMTDRFLVNPTFEQGDIGWDIYGTSTFSQNSISSVTSGWFDCMQTTYLPAGNYKLTCNGFQRLGPVATAYQNHKSGTEPEPCVALTAFVQNGPPIVGAIHCMFDNERHAEFTDSWTNGDGYYYPMNIFGAEYCFAQGMYKNEMTFTVPEAGDVRLGAYSDSQQNNAFFAYSNFRLYRDGEIVPLKSITLSESEISLLPTESCFLQLTMQPENASYNIVSWSSSDNDVAYVDNYGNVTAVNYGTCVITAQSEDPSMDESVTCTVNVVPPTSRADGLVINEIMVSNANMYLDPSFNYGSWIELYNPTNEKILLSGLYISDDPDNLKKFRLPMTYGILHPNKYDCIFFDHNGIWNRGELHQVNFKLDYDGGTIYISDDNGILIQQDYPAAVSRTSYARTTDGGSEWGITYTPSRYASNAGSEFAVEQVEAPVFSHESGLFNEDFLLQITAPEGSILYVTTDGTVPSVNNYNLIAEDGKASLPFAGYGGSIRARAFKAGMLPSEVVTRSYIKNHGFTLPIINVTVDFEDLFGEDYGIMNSASSINGRPGNGQFSNKNYNMDWDRPVNFEYFSADGSSVFSQEVDMSMCGGWSRAFTPHSFKLKANKLIDGKGSLNYPFFKNKPFLKHKALQIRQGGNDNTSRIKDAALQQVVVSSGLNIDAQESQPVHVFFNSNYYATLNMREPNNKHFAYANYGIDSDDIDQFEMSPDSGYVQKEGTDDAFLRWYDLSEDAADPDIYNEIAQLVDIDEYINYMAVEFYLANKDWPQNNIKGFRSRKDGKFHFVLFDLDQAFQLSDNTVFTTFAGKKTHLFDTLYGMDANGNDYYYVRWNKEIKMVTIFLNMLKNDTFRKRFIDTFCIVGGSVFEPSRVKEIVSERRDYMIAARNAIDSDFRKTSYDNDSYYNPSTSASEIITKLTTERNTTMMTTMKSYAAFDLKSVAAKTMKLTSNIDDATLFINDIEVPTGKFNGKVFCPVKFTAKAPAGYRFRGWTKNIRTNLLPDEYEYLTTEATYELPTSSTPTLLRAVFEPVSEAELKATNMRPVMVNEVSAKNSVYVNDYNKKADWIELYNTTDTDIDLAGLYLSDNAEDPMRYQIPTGSDALNTVIPAHGHKIVWMDKSESISDQLHASFKLDADSGIVMITAVPGVCDPSLFTPAFSSEWSDVLTYTTMLQGQTFGRYPDGGVDNYLMNTPTIGKANQLGYYSAFVWSEPTDAVAIQAVATEGLGHAVQYYTVSGTPIARPMPGTNIVRFSDGKTKKIFIR